MYALCNMNTHILNILFYEKHKSKLSRRSITFPTLIRPQVIIMINLAIYEMYNARRMQDATLQIYDEEVSATTKTAVHLMNII